MVDLKGQYNKIKTEINQAIQEVIDSTLFINGPSVNKFQNNLEKYLQVKNVIPCANGTDALQIAMMALDLKPGDEVITSSFTFIATAEVIALLKLTPVLVDCYSDTMNISIEALEKAITPKTKAIVPVHLFGQSANMEEIMKIAKKYNLYVIEDACQSIGADYTFLSGEKKKVGTIGHIGCTSFFPSKNLGCYGDGGALFTNDTELAKKIKGICNHGSFKKYYHELIGCNSRLDSIQAAILDVKLKYLDEYTNSRNYAAHFYNEKLKNNNKLITPQTASFTNHVFHQYTLQLINFDRDILIQKMSEKGIPVMVYYPVPLHKQKAYIDTRYKEGDFPISEHLADNVFSLPMHTELTDNQLIYICNSLIEILNN